MRFRPTVIVRESSRLLENACESRTKRDVASKRPTDGFLGLFGSIHRGASQSAGQGFESPRLHQSSFAACEGQRLPRRSGCMPRSRAPFAELRPGRPGHLPSWRVMASDGVPGYLRAEDALKESGLLPCVRRPVRDPRPPPHGSRDSPSRRGSGRNPQAYDVLKGHRRGKRFRFNLDDDRVPGESLIRDHIRTVPVRSALVLTVLGGIIGG